MKIVFSTLAKDLRGNVINDGPDGEALTIGTLAVRALVVSLPGDEKLTGETKYKLAKLAGKIDVDGEVEITVDEAALIKSRVGSAYGPVPVYAVWNHLEGHAA